MLVLTISRIRYYKTFSNFCQHFLICFKKDVQIPLQRIFQACRVVYITGILDKYRAVGLSGLLVAIAVRRAGLILFLGRA